MFLFYSRENLLVVDIYYEELNFELFKENKALTFSGLISKYTKVQMLLSRDEAIRYCLDKHDKVLKMGLL